MREGEVMMRAKVRQSNKKVTMGGRSVERVVGNRANRKLHEATMRKELRVVPEVSERRACRGKTSQTIIISGGHGGRNCGGMQNILSREARWGGGGGVGGDKIAPGAPKNIERTFGLPPPWEKSVRQGGGEIVGATERACRERRRLGRRRSKEGKCPWQEILGNCQGEPSARKVDNLTYP